MAVFWGSFAKVLYQFNQSVKLLRTNVAMTFKYIYNISKVIEVLNSRNVFANVYLLRKII